MISAVLDTNTIVSATLFARGPSGQIWQAANQREFALITSAWIVAEVVRALNRNRIQRKYTLPPNVANRVQAYLEHQTILLPLTREVRGVATHPEDDFILATAVSGQADYLVTGDKKLQDLHTFEGVKIVSPRQFLRVLESESENE